MWLTIIIAIIAIALAILDTVDRYFEHKENIEAIKRGVSLERTNEEE